MTRPTITSVFSALLADLGSDASRRGYKIDWEQFTCWLAAEKIPVLKATPRDIKRYVVHQAERGLAQRTRGRALSVIRAVYGALVAEELLKYNPAREVKNTKAGKANRPVTWLEEDALAKMLSFGSSEDDLVRRAGEFLKGTKRTDADYAAVEEWFQRALWTDRRDRMCIQLLAGTGRRRAEVARMCVEDFTDEGVTGVVKGGGVKTAPVPEWLRRELAEWLEFAGIKSGPVLPWSETDSGAINGDAVYAIVKRVAVACGIEPDKVSPHSLRRTLATLSERRNVPLVDIQAQLNHRSIQTTETYLKSSHRVAEAPGEWMGKLARPREET